MGERGKSMATQIIINPQNIIEMDEMLGKHLTKQEIAVIRYLSEEMSDKAIAEAMFISWRTITVHLTHCYRKLGITNRTALVLWAVKNGVA